MYYFIINPKSSTGNGLKIWHQIKTELDSQKIIYNSYFTEFELHAAKLAHQICKLDPGLKRIVVVGGDGTVNEVINGIISYQNILLGYIPSGSGNDLAKSLNLPNDPIVNLNNILNTKRFPSYDIGRIWFPDGSYQRKYTISSGIGLDASICYEALHSGIKKMLNHFRLGKLTYVLIALKQLLWLQPTDGEIIIDGETHMKLKGIYFIASMIQPYEGGGFKMAPLANPTDGKLSVAVFYNLSKLKALLILPCILFEKQSLFKGFKTFNCTTLEVRTQKPLMVHTDGEYAGKTSHLKTSCISEKLHMFL